jgi:hypothetical protein
VLQRAQTGARGEWLIDLVRDRGGNLSEGGEAQRMCQLSLATPQLFFRRYSFGDFGLQIGGPRLNGRFERLFGASALLTSQKGHDGAHHERDEPRQIVGADLKAEARLGPEKFDGKGR